MSDHEPELPNFLTEAVLDEGPSPEAVELVKAAFTWRDLERDLLALTFDSAQEPAGVRDSSDARTIEFSNGETAVILDLVGRTVTGRLHPARAGTARLRLLGDEVETVVDEDGSFRFLGVGRGAARIDLDLGDLQMSSGVFTIY